MRNDITTTTREFVCVKRCTGCKRVLPVEMFSKNRASRDGLVTRCKPCLKIEYKKNKERYAQYYRDHKEELNEYSRNYRRENADYWRKWKQDHPEAVAVSRQNDRAKRSANGGRISKRDWRRILDAFNHCCAKCGSSENIHMDHVVPLARGGANSIDNVQPLCQTCNLRKGAKTEDYRGRLYRKVPLLE